MALNTYTNLQTSLLAWLARPDLTTTVPDLIALAEGIFNTDLRTRYQEAIVNLTIAGESNTLPNDFLEVRSIRRRDSQRTPLSALPDDGVLCASSDRPYYTVAGNTLIWTPPAGTQDVTFKYYAKIPPLALNTTNWLLTLYPNAYLYGALLQGQVYIQDDPRLPMFKAGYDEIMAKIKASAGRSVGGPGLQMRVA